jgi:general secretion pathway protein C
MRVFSIKVPTVVGHNITMRGVIFIVGKISLIAAVYFAWSMGDNLRRAHGAKLPEVDLSVVEDNGGERTKSDFSSYSVILSRNIFGQQKDKSDGAKTAQPATSLKLRLVGTNMNPGTGSFAIIENGANKDQDVFELNEMIFDQAKLVEIQPERVKLERNGKIEVLMLEDGTEGGGGSTGITSEASPGEDKTDFTVAEDELNGELANLPRLLSQARAVPYFRNGKSVGMRLFAIRAGSMYEKLGLKNGDIIKAVNNNNLSDPAQALKLFEQLKNERTIAVKTERNGQDLDLNYTIR